MIVVLCGPPASGKSTIARELARRLKGSKVITSDEFKRKTYKHVFEEAERLAGKVKYLILNGTFYKRVWQERAREIGREKKERVLIVRITCPLKICVERNRKRKNPIPERVVRIIHREFEEPRADTTIDTKDTSPDDAVETIIAEYWRNKEVDGEI
ncbi:MAG: AAA family ATPase [Hadesarchaea archaeon]|nr:AAA family ATPase [Hadesarchaea archaeon]